MSVRYTSHVREVNFAVDRAASLAIRNMLEATHTEASPNTPRQYGDLRDNVVKSVQGTSGSIVWMQKYAAAQETGTIHGSRVTNYTTPGTGPQYAENAVKKVVSNSNKHFQDALRSIPRTSSQQGGV